MPSIMVSPSFLHGTSFLSPLLGLFEMVGGGGGGPPAPPPPPPGDFAYFKGIVSRGKKKQTKSK